MVSKDRMYSSFSGLPRVLLALLLVLRFPGEDATALPAARTPHRGGRQCRAPRTSAGPTGSYTSLKRGLPLPTRPQLLWSQALTPQGDVRPLAGPGGPRDPPASLHRAHRLLRALMHGRQASRAHTDGREGRAPVPEEIQPPIQASHPSTRFPDSYILLSSSGSAKTCSSFWLC